MGNAVIYARYSSHNQREASISDQIRVCREAAERNGDRIVKVYSERAKSGTDAIHRPQFLRMIDDSKKGGFRVVYVYKMDRFARKRLDSVLYKYELKKNGVSLVSVMEPMTDGPEAILLEALLEADAEFYSANLSVNVRRGLEGNALRCGHNGCRVFGYENGADGLYHIDPDEAPVVLMAFQMYDAGSSLSEIVKALEPYRTPRGNPFVKSVVARMMTNEKYMGTYHYGEHRVEGGMPAIVPSDLFWRVNGKLGNRRRGAVGDYPLSGKLFDAEGRPFSGSSAHGKGGVYYYYRVIQTGEAYRRDAIDGAVYQAVADFLAADESMRDAVAEAVVLIQDEAIADDVSLAESMRSRLKELDREASNMLDLAARTGASDLVVKRLNDIEEERATLESELIEVELASPRLTKEDVLATMQSIIDIKAPTAIVDAFVSRVVIDGDRMTVTFNVSELPGDGPDGGGTPPSPDDKGPAKEGCSRSYRLVELAGRHTNFLTVEVNAYSFRLVLVWA